jgi:hypothetical protein
MYPSYSIVGEIDHILVSSLDTLCSDNGHILFFIVAAQDDCSRTPALTCSNACFLPAAGVS